MDLTGLLSVLPIGAGPVVPSEFGMEAYIPVFSSTDKVTQQTEGGTVTVPRTALEGTEVKTMAGQIVISQQMEDRSLTGAGGSCASQWNNRRTLR